MGYEFHGMTIPGGMLDDLMAYVEHGYEPGDFLCAVISNDLTEACGRADDRNLHIIAAYVAWLYNEAPSTCWGSKAKMDAWIADKAEERESNAKAAARRKAIDDAEGAADARYDQEKDDRLTEHGR